MKTIVYNLLLLTAVLCISVSAKAQTFTVTGHIGDAVDKTPLIDVTVILMSNADTNNKNGTVTDDDGNYELDGVTAGNYTMRCIYTGYKVVTQSVAVKDKNVAVPAFTMTTANNELKGVTVEGKQIRATQMGDTTQFNADAYKTHPDATAEDLVTKMPGVSSDASGVKVNGESVQQVYIDGKPFFGTDPTLALKNLPAEVIDKIQVFDKLSDQSQFTGFDDGNSQKTINIITKKNKSEGVFGKAFAGYGTDDRYIAGGSLNIFNGDQRISIIGLSNNVNQQNFSSQDILGVTGGSGQNRGGGGSGRGGGSANNFLVGQQGGITTTNSVGLNYSDVWAKKIKVSGSYFFNSTDNTTETDLARNYFTQDSPQVYHETDNAETKNLNHRFNLRFEYNIDSANTIIFTPSVSFQTNNSNTEQVASDSIGDQRISSTVNSNIANSTGYNTSGNLLFQHKFHKPRRTISVNVSAAVNEKSGDGSYAMQNMFNTTGDTSYTQRYNLYNFSQNFSSNVTYTEPVGKKGQIMVNYNPSYVKSNADRETNNLDVATNVYSLLDTALSNKYNNTYITQRGGISYRVASKKLNFMVGVNLQSATLSGDEYFPVDTTITKTYNSILPTAMLNYRFSDGRNLRIMYRTSVTAPSVTQLQDVIDVSNPLLLKGGNPGLKQDYEQTLTLRYGLTKSKTAHNFFIYGYANYINNYIGNQTIIPTNDSSISFTDPYSKKTVVIKEGSQLTRPMNLNGYFNSKLFLTYGIPADFIKSNINFNGGMNYTRTPGQINDAINMSDNYAPTAGIVVSSNVSQNLDFTLAYTGNYNIVKNSIETAANNDYYSHVASFKINYILFNRLVINSNIAHNYYTAFSSTGDQSYFLWTSYLGYKFLKNQALEARLTAYDMLNQNKSISRTVTDTYIENSTTQVLKQYLMFQLTYTVRNFKGAAPDAPPPPDGGPDGGGHGGYPGGGGGHFHGSGQPN